MGLPALSEDLRHLLDAAGRPQLCAALAFISAKLVSEETADDPEFIGLLEAARLCNVKDRKTMITWAVKFGLGHKLDPEVQNSRWVFDKRKVLAHLGAIS
ncbi:MAG: hypothetical protein JJ864_07540 [Rhizobiaceae bacterium]|nr:hypothetical protein [Rhizobiaceae bacterium]